MRPDIQLEALADSLRAAGILASLRGSALRVSPNAYNHAQDVAALTEVLAAV